MIWFLILISLSAFAHEDCAKCVPENAVSSSVGSLEEFSKRLEHFSADPTQVMNAPCKTKTFDVQEMNQSLSALSGKKDKSIRGVKFTDESPVLLNAFQTLTQKNRLSWLEKLFRKTPPERNIQAEFNVNPGCEKVVCAVDKIWGRDVGRKLLYLFIHHRYNGSDLLRPEAAKFTDPELDDILMTLNDLPKSLRPLGKNRPLMKFKKEAISPEQSPLLWANSTVHLFTPWVEGPKYKRQYVLFHEFGHNLHGTMGPQKYDEWLRLSNWVKAGDRWEFDSIGACVTSNYAMTHPNEDFAEAASAYRYNGRAFLAQCPEKYRYMKENVFNHVEYREESQCFGK